MGNYKKYEIKNLYDNILEVWIEDTYLATLTKFEAKVAMTNGDILRPRDLWKGKKLLELEGSGSLTMGKYSSIGIQLMHTKLSQGGRQL